MTKVLLKTNYIMGYNLKNARKGKSILKIPKWPSLKNQTWDSTVGGKYPHRCTNCLSNNPDFDLSTRYSIH